MLTAPGLVGCLLLAQLAPLSGQTQPGQTQPGQTQPGQNQPGQTQSGQTQSGQTPPTMVAEAVALPDAAVLPGQRFSLMEVLAVAPPQADRAKIVHAYWDLSEAVAALNRTRAQADRLAALTVRAEDEPILAQARAEADAAREEALATAAASQHELADQVGLPPTAALPLPSDPPHAGPYRTRFEELFANRPAPSRVRLLAATLPIRLRAIEHRVRAVEAAQRAVTSLDERYRNGATDLERVLAAMDRSDESQRALLHAVCEYNHEIVDYVGLAIDWPIESPALVSLLIQPAGGRPSETARPTDNAGTFDAGTPGGVLPASGFESPSPTRAPARADAVPAGPVPAGAEPNVLPPDVLPSGPSTIPVEIPPAMRPGMSPAVPSAAPNGFRPSESARPLGGGWTPVEPEVTQPPLVPASPPDTITPPEPEAPKLRVIPE